MEKILAVLLALALIFSFAACGDKKPDPQNNPEPITDPKPTEPEQKELFANEQELRDFLSGMWVNDVEKPFFYIGLCSDGTLIIFNDMEMACNAYAGTWDLEHLYTEENQLPDLLVMPLTDYDDEYIAGLDSAGDYLISEIDKDAYIPHMHLDQANNGDSLYDIYYDEYYIDMYKISETVDFTNPAELNRY